MPISKRKLLKPPNEKPYEKSCPKLAKRARRVLEESMSARYIFISIKEEELGSPL